MRFPSLRRGSSVSAAGTLAEFDTALPDKRVWKIRAKLGARFRLPPEVDFATYVQPAHEAERNGLSVLMPENVVFLVVSPNPHPRWTNKIIKTFAIVDSQDWLATDKRRAISDADPAIPIFAELCRQHMAARQHWRELN